MKKRIAKVLCAAVLGGSLAVTAFPGVAMAAKRGRIQGSLYYT